MNPDHSPPPRHLPDFDDGLEGDDVWKVLDEASPVEVPPRFTADTLRRCRLETGSSEMPWWQKLFAPKPLIATAATALAVVAIVISLPGNPTPAPAQTQASPPNPAPSEDWENLEDTLARELLSGAAEDPSLLSDEEIVSLLF